MWRTALRLRSVRENLRRDKEAKAARGLSLRSWFSVGCRVHCIVGTEAFCVGVASAVRLHLPLPP